ncbi:MAG: PilZ domain-containing protein [Pseudomonadales bacterium]
MTALQQHERRGETRLCLPGIKLKVRKHRFTRSGGFATCTAIDVSASGFSFKSAELKLDALDKVDFELSVQNNTVSGHALVCHVEKDGKSATFGLMFLQTSPDISEILDASVLDKLEVQLHAQTVAKEVALKLGYKTQDLQIRRMQKALFAAVDEFAIELADLLPAKDLNQCMANFLQRNSREHTVTFRRLTETGLDTTTTVAVRFCENKKDVRYHMEPFASTTSIYEVVEIMGQAFAQLYQPQLARVS